MNNEKINTKKVRLVSFVSFVFGFLDAFFIYILSSYFTTLVPSLHVGVFYFVAYGIVLLSLLYLERLVRFVGQARALYLSLGGSIVSASLLATGDSILLLVVGALLLLVVTNITWVTLDILLESFSSDRVSGTIRGLYLTIMNAGLLSAPFLSLKTLDTFGYSGIFLVLVVGYIVVFLIALVAFRHDNFVPRKRMDITSGIGRLWRERNLFRIYSISFALEFFYALMIVYTPLYLRLLGFSWEEIGIMFTLMLLPFVLLQYPLGVLADRYFGEKELLIGSIAVAALATGILPFLGEKSVVVWGTALFFTRVGIAGIEILRDAYFYKQIDVSDLDTIAFFRTARPLANIVGALLSGVTLLFLPLQSIFLIVAVVLIWALFETFFLTDTISLKERIKAHLP